VFDELFARGLDFARMLHIEADPDESHVLDLLELGVGQLNDFPAVDKRPHQSLTASI
jgi:hypothetical protein